MYNLRVIVAVVVLHQLDIRTCAAHGPLQEEILTHGTSPHWPQCPIHPLLVAISHHYLCYCRPLQERIPPQYNLRL